MIENIEITDSLCRKEHLGPIPPPNLWMVPVKIKDRRIVGEWIFNHFVTPDFHTRIGGLGMCSAYSFHGFWVADDYMAIMIHMRWGEE